MHSATPDKSSKAIALWLLTLCVLIFAMVVLGGVTRLTGSGLSMVDWEPVMGVIPPLNDAQWQDSFARYQAFPEYQKKNISMDLAGYKSIFWFEFLHRLLGRSIGLAFLLPFLYFWWRGRIPRPLVPKLLVMFVLGGLQGLLGWYMVKSGLVNDPHVSQYRLTAHLAAAFLIYAYIFWVAMDLLYPRHEHGATALRPWALALTGLLAITVLSGGFVAGLKAGYAYSTFPLMDGRLIPAAYWLLKPGWKNLFENIATVQFNHRLLATLLLSAVIGLWGFGRRMKLSRRARHGLQLLLGMALLQVSLGIATLLLHVPVALASAHQAGALLLFTLALWVSHAMRE